MKLFYKLGAECCFAKQLYQECVHTILEALKFNPEDPGIYLIYIYYIYYILLELWCLYAKVFIMKRIFEYAKPLLERALQFDADYVEARELLGVVRRELNN